MPPGAINGDERLDWFDASNGKVKVRSSLPMGIEGKEGHPIMPRVGAPNLADHEFRPINDKDQYWMVIKKGKGYVDVQLPKALVKDRPKTIELMWITQFTR